MSGYLPGTGDYGAGVMNPLVPVVKPLNSAAKKAMFGAASAGLIKRGSWNGCAWNMAGVEAGEKNISSSTAASALFGVDQKYVDRFIRLWDQLPGTDETCTLILREALETVGLFEEPNLTGRVTRVVRGYAYKSWETRMTETLEQEAQNGLILGMEEMVKVLSGTAPSC